MKKKTRYALAGWLAATAINSLNQDALGKEAYMKLTDLCWRSGYITVPLAIMVLLVAIAMLCDNKE